MDIRRRPPNPRVKVASLEYAIPHKESQPRNILEEIVWEKDREIEIAKQKISLNDLKSKINNLPNTKDFINAILQASIKPGVIAEIKKASPSRGIICEDFDHMRIAREYENGGASCISVLTDKKFFKGDFKFITEIRKSINIPILCKEFIISPYQIYQARTSGADAILLIASILSDQDIKYLNKVAKSINLAVLIEIHNEEEMCRVLSIGGFNLIGINNRDLKTFNTNIETTEILAKQFAKELRQEDILLVSESGLFTRSDLSKVYESGARGVLVGESLMRQKNITNALKKLING